MTKLSNHKNYLFYWPFCLGNILKRLNAGHYIISFIRTLAMVLPSISCVLKRKHSTVQMGIPYLKKSNDLVF